LSGGRGRSGGPGVGAVRAAPIVGGDSLFIFGGGRGARVGGGGVPSGVGGGRGGGGGGGGARGGGGAGAGGGGSALGFLCRPLFRRYSAHAATTGGREDHSDEDAGRSANARASAAGAPDHHLAAVLEPGRDVSGERRRLRRDSLERRGSRHIAIPYPDRAPR